MYARLFSVLVFGLALLASTDARGELTFEQVLKDLVGKEQRNVPISVCTEKEYAEAIVGAELSGGRTLANRLFQFHRQNGDCWQLPPGSSFIFKEILRMSSGPSGHQGAVILVSARATGDSRETDLFGIAVGPARGRVYLPDGTVAEEEI